MADHMRSSHIIENLQGQRQRGGRKTRDDGAMLPVSFADRSSGIIENLQSSCQAIQDARDTSQAEELKQNQQDDDRRDVPDEPCLHADPSCGHSSPSSLSAITWRSAWDVLHTPSYICRLRSDTTHGGTLSRMGGRLQKGACNVADPSRRNSTHAASTAVALLFLVRFISSLAHNNPPILSLLLFCDILSSECRFLRCWLRKKLLHRAFWTVVSAIPSTQIVWNNQALCTAFAKLGQASLPIGAGFKGGNVLCVLRARTRTL